MSHLASATISDRTLRRFGRTLSGLSIASAPVGMGLATSAGQLGNSIESWVAVNSLMALVYGLLGLLLIRSEPRNMAVWLVIGAGVTSALPAALGGLWDMLAAGQGVTADELDTSGWPPGLAPLFALGYSSWVFANYGTISLGLQLTPDGRPVSRRWLPLAWLGVAILTAIWLLQAVAWPIRDAGDAAEQYPILGLLTALGAFLFVPLSFVSLAERYRRADLGVRRHLRWMLYGGVWIVVMLIADQVIETPLGFELLVYPVLALSYGMAIWRDQLFDIDRLIARTLLYGALATFIAAVYVGVVVGVGSLLGQSSGHRSALSLAATVAVAFGVQPVRRRLEHGANRLVYGRRASPYEVLADLSARLRGAESTDGLLDRMATLLGQATGAEQAVVWRRIDDEAGGAAGAGRLEPLAVWPVDATPVPDPDDVGPDQHLVSIERAGEALGAVSVTKPAGDDLTPTERRLLDDLAGSAGLVLDRARLDTALAAQADALAQSRRRLVDAQSDERQRLERQLDAGTRRYLTDLAVGLDDGARRASAAALGPIGQQLEALAAEVRTAGDEIAALAQGMYPQVLESEGLVAAVESLAAGLPLLVVVDGNVGDEPTSALDRDVELAVYFSIAEALTNVVKHAEARSVSVRIDRSDHDLRFEVVDDGRGFEAGVSNGSSTGLAGLGDRIDTVGGTITIRSRPGAGTTIAGSVPVPVAGLTTVGGGG